MLRRAMGGGLLLVCGVILSGCGDAAPPELEAPVRAIKHMTLGERAGAAERRLAGVVRAGTQSSVAFEIGGQVMTLGATVGAEVTEGAMLAALDPRPYELQVEQAEFTLAQAEATLEDAQSKFDQQKELFDRGFATRTALDTATTNLRNAQGQVGIATSQLDLRRRDLAKTMLVAPFSGSIVSQEVDVFEEITAGRAIYVLQTEGEYEIEVSVPETMLSQVSVGQAVTVTFPPLSRPDAPDAPAEEPVASGLISELAPRAGDANAFPMTVLLREAPTGLRPGMSAEVTIQFETVATDRAFSVPVTALKPDISSDAALVYVFDAEASVVRERPVQVIGISGNNPQIVGEVADGDVIATAGVGHMHDGMSVRLMTADDAFQ